MGHKRSIHYPCSLLFIRPDGTPPQELILAKTLGPQPSIYTSTSHGVELEIQAGSLTEEVHHPVTVSPRLQFVECATEGSGRWEITPLHDITNSLVVIPNVGRMSPVTLYAICVIATPTSRSGKLCVSKHPDSTKVAGPTVVGRFLLYDSSCYG